MTFLKSPCMIFCFFLHTFSLLAQIDKPNYSLLWEISGKDLPKPCYLFGTMHLRDERVFELSDSVLIALESCGAFAMEVHPDSAMSYILELSLNEDSSNAALLKMLDRKDFDELEEMLKENVKFNMDSLFSQKPELLEKMLKGVKESPFAKKRPQILDLTLFAYAQGLGKSMHGLEHMRDYKDLTTAFFEQTADTTSVRTTHHFSLNSLVEPYRQGDIDKILGIIDERLANGKYRMELLDNRNRVMAKEMVSLGREQSIFCAVGAGHLPGNNGILALLRHEGYQVRRVGANFTGVADSLFQLKQSNKEGLIFTDEQGGYSAVLPTSPIFQRFEQAMEDDDEQPSIMTGRVHLSTDLRQGRQFMIMTMDYPPSLVFNDKSVLFEAVERGYEEQWGPKIGQSKTVFIDGQTGRAMKFRMQGSIINVQVTMRGNRFYAFTTTYPTGMIDTFSNQFFQSVRLLPFHHSSLQRVQLPQIACSVALPGKYEFKADTSDTYSYPTELTLSYSAADSLSANTYTIVETTRSKYYEVENPDSFLINYKLDLEADTAYTIKDTLFKSMPAFYFMKEDTANLVFVDHLVMLTDDGGYDLIVHKSSQGDEKRSWEFFNTFEPGKSWTGQLLTRETTALVFADLNSQDSITAEKAKTALRNQSFTEEDLPAIFELLNQPMPWDTNQWNGAHVSVMTKLDEMEDERILPFLKTYFVKNNNYKYRQAKALETLLSFGNKEAYAAFYELAPTIDTTAGHDIPVYGLSRYFYADSSLVLEHMAELFELRKHPTYRDIVYNAFATCLESNMANRAPFQPFAADFIKEAWNLVETDKLLSYKDSLPDFENRWAFMSLATIASYLPPSSGAVDFLRKMLVLPDKWLLCNIVTGLLRQGETVDKAVFEKIHDDPYVWYYLISNFDDEGYLQKIPKKLLDVGYFIKGGIPSMLYDDEVSAVNNFKIMEKRQCKYNDELLWLYVFSYQVDYEPETTYIGVCTQPKAGGLSVKPAIFNTSYTAFDGENKEEIISEILSNYEGLEMEK